MDNRVELRDFLVSRRARLTPEDAGVPTFGGVRRVPGLRREEVAHLAGVSVDYYNRLERGRATGISPEVLDAVARALRLDDVEREYLGDLFDALRHTPAAAHRRPRHEPVRPALRAVVDAIALPAFLQNARLEIVAANRLGHALYAEAGGFLDLPFSMPRFLFLDPRSRAFFQDWDRSTHNQVALLRSASGRFPGDAELLTLLEDLQASSETFRELWESHDVLKYRRGTKRYRHELVGTVEFVGESFDVSTDDELALLTYTYAPVSATAEAMRILDARASGVPSERAHTASVSAPDRTLSYRRAQG